MIDLAYASLSAPLGSVDGAVASGTGGSLLISSIGGSLTMTPVSGTTVVLDGPGVYRISAGISGSSGTPVTNGALTVVARDGTSGSPGGLLTWQTRILPAGAAAGFTATAVGVATVSEALVVSTSIGVDSGGDRLSVLDGWLIIERIG